jgi:Pyruvate/2-oxoacid:ferredoxin oxidoreductase delta subunit/bacterioferritin-associated ferredoxin
MKTVRVQPQVDMELCRGCKNCQMVCPVYAIEVSRVDGKPQVKINYDVCVGCWNCEQRCPDHAIAMAPCEPFDLATDVSRFDYGEIRALCRKAHFHPKQIVCYCTATRAEELAAAILDGASDPAQLVRATGAGSGCGIECNQPILRFLEAADITFERPKQSYQWYGRTATVWDVSDKVKKEHPGFRFDNDRELLDSVVDAPVHNLES